MKKLFLLTLLTTSLVVFGAERLDGGTCDSCKKDELIRQYEAMLQTYNLIYYSTASALFASCLSAWLFSNQSVENGNRPDAA